jgi:hypothetical protein
MDNNRNCNPQPDDTGKNEGEENVEQSAHEVSNEAPNSDPPITNAAPTPPLTATDVLAGLWTSDRANMTMNYETRTERSRIYPRRRLQFGAPIFNTYVPRVRRNVVDWNLHMSVEQHQKILRTSFLDLCQKGTPAQMEDFLKRHPRFDTHFDNEAGFIKACMENTKDMVEYLYNRLSPDVTISHDEPFRYACLMNQIEVAYYLQTICPRYEFQIRFRRPTDPQRRSNSEIYRDYVIDNEAVQTDKDKAPKVFIDDGMDQMVDEDYEFDSDYEYEYVDEEEENNKEHYDDEFRSESGSES